MLRPKLIVNKQLIQEIIGTETPCFALGLMEENEKECGFLALCPDRNIPGNITEKGFRLGHVLLGNRDIVVCQFIFELYGFETYNVLINPNNAVVQTVLTTMLENKDYFFFVINPDQSVTTFRSEIGEDDLVGIKTNMSQIQKARTTDSQYEKALASFKRNPEPIGSTLLNWVCRNNIEYLDLTKDRLEMSPTYS